MRLLRPWSFPGKITGVGCHFLLQSATSTAAIAKLLQSCPTLCDPIGGSPPGFLSLGFSRQEHWSGLPFPSQCMKVKSESEDPQSCPTLRDPMDCSPRGSSCPNRMLVSYLKYPCLDFLSCLYNYFQR